MKAAILLLLCSSAQAWTVSEDFTTLTLTPQEAAVCKKVGCVFLTAPKFKELVIELAADSLQPVAKDAFDEGFKKGEKKGQQSCRRDSSV